MKVGTAFPSKYLKAADLQGREVVVTIDSVEMANIGDDEDKLVVYFQGGKNNKGMVLNRTNANMITEIAGTDETDEWHGVKIKLYSCRVDFQGRRVDALRVDFPPKAPAESNGHRPLVTPNVAPNAPASEVSDDDIPW